MLKVWKETGYKDFADGKFGNGGQNIYVSRKGVLQRIFRNDLNKDGYIDLLFVNSQDMDECVPAYVYSNIFDNLQIRELPTNGAYAAAVVDLNGDGYDDLVIANQHNGRHADITAYIYYGSPDGLSERYKIELPAPNCRAVAIGDFNGDGRPDIAFSSEGKLRAFYQEEKGFLAGKYTDYDIEITHMTAADIDGDGYADLYVRVRNGAPRVLWGGCNGLNIERYTKLDFEDRMASELPSSTPGRMTFVEGWSPKILKINGSKYSFCADDKIVRFYQVSKDRNFIEAIGIECGNVVSAAVGDIDGDGIDDIVLAVCANHNETELSWIYWGGPEGYSNDNRTPISTVSARDVVIADFDGDGLIDIAICQGATDIINTTESLIFKGNGSRNIAQPLKVTTHDATCALIAKSSEDANPQLIFINREGGRVRGDVPAYIYYGSPEGFSAEYRDELPGWSASSAICCDFNDNGWADVLLCNCAENAPHIDPGSYIYWGGPDGFDPNNKLVIPSNRTWGAAVGDFRHSGYIDLAVVGFSNPEVLIFKGSNNGFDLENPQRIMMDRNLSNYVPGKNVIPQEVDEGKEFREPRFILAADFNNDGWLDLVITQILGQHCYILWGGPKGFSMERSTRLPVEGSVYPQAADLNEDGWLDLIIGSYHSMGKNFKMDSYVNIFWGGPEGFSSSRCTQLPAHAADSITIADFNNDGMLDIFVGSYHGGRTRDLDSYIYWGKSGGIYEADNRTRLYTHSASGCIAADFNEDGWVDLAVANHKMYGNHQGKSFVWWNGPDGFSEKRVTQLPTLGPHGMTGIDPGNIMDRGQEEYYISSEFELPEGAKVVAISWETEIQPKTWVKAQIRFANSIKELDNASWQGSCGYGDWFQNNQKIVSVEQTGRWIQYRLALGAVNGGNSPRVTEVSVVYDV